ncbi:LacI family DNA-binding transcriptional regulator [Bifidobacterium felsineum]|uniref:LacI family transcriptional regulator n=1 Tax=Bifidobacterium felsineum TaxID=2045440 RepID=A0A2M9HJ66_9BIFI|nr:LacI family DNA-binding transcriptional regulator [Bifidobacterium felsineum]MBT1163736.1 LacI family DNA-binding transcriptional regulator [Bifidobacterium felsineum]PJM76856.1 LacI family transcriptional regulator [Bifidobacterium felsineum]
MAFVTIRDIAQEAGVSVTAVSQILHDKGRFSEQTRELVRQTAERLGYVPDQRARAMRSASTQTVGLLVPDLRNQYFADMVSSMEEELYRRGFTTLIGSYGERVDRQDAFLRSLLGQRIDGAIVVPQGGLSQGLQLLIERKLPLVFVDRLVPGADNVPFVVSDPRPGLEEALDQLAKLGHRVIGFVAHSALGSFSVNERAKAFSAAIRERIPSGTGVVVDCNSTVESRSSALERLHNAGVTAIICAYSPDAITMLGLLQERGIAIGDAVSLVSFDDIAAFRLMIPQVSVISQQADEMGRLGVEMLIRRIASGTEAAAHTHYVPTILHMRGSCGIAVA